MILTDYYQLLDLKPSATLPEIKKAYRKLALQYHPDRNNNDPYAAAQFAAIKEAYETLTHPSKKEHYLQQRWYHQSRGKKFAENEPVTPVSVLKQCLELNRYVTALDSHRMDKEGLAQYICDLLTDSTLESLQNFGDTAINRTIITSLLQAMEPLRRRQVEKIMQRISKLAEADAEANKLIAVSKRQRTRQESFEKYQPLFIILLTVVICFLIYIVSR